MQRSACDCVVCMSRVNYHRLPPLSLSHPVQSREIGRVKAPPFDFNSLSCLLSIPPSLHPSFSIHHTHTPSPTPTHSNKRRKGNSKKAVCSQHAPMLPRSNCHFLLVNSSPPFVVFNTHTLHFFRPLPSRPTPHLIAQHNPSDSTFPIERKSSLTLKQDILLSQWHSNHIRSPYHRPTRTWSGSRPALALTLSTTPPRSPWRYPSAQETTMPSPSSLPCVDVPARLLLLFRPPLLPLPIPQDTPTAGTSPTTLITPQRPYHQQRRQRHPF